MDEQNKAPLELADGLLPEGHSSVQIDQLCLETLWLPASGSDFSWVLLHEGLGCIDLWRDFPQRLQQHTGDAVFCWSRQGYGRSDAVALPRPLDYMSHEANKLKPLLDRVPGKQLGLLGHSDGASIAALYSGLNQDQRLAATLLVAPHFYTEQIALDSIAEARVAFESGELRARLKKYHQQNVDCAFRGWNDAWLDPGFRRWDIRSCLSGIRVPMVLLQGENDKYGSREQLQTAAQLSAADTRTVLIPECDHWPHLESPEILLAACDTLKYMASHPG